MFLSRFKISAAAVLLFAATNFAQNVLSNGNMEYGDGGWYLWNNPDGPAKVELKLAEPGLGFDGSQGAKLVVKELPKIYNIWKKYLCQIWQSLSKNIQAK